jgi:hypothetical protein
MKVSGFSRYALCVSTRIAVPAGCNRSQAAIATHGAHGR